MKQYNARYARWQQDLKVAQQDKAAVTGRRAVGSEDDVLSGRISVQFHGDAEPRPLVNAGWLSTEHQYPTGAVPEELAAKLARLCRSGVQRTRGWHFCALGLATVAVLARARALAAAGG